MKKIIAFSGSNSSSSLNQRLVQMVAQLATEIQVEVIDLRDYPAPFYSSDLEKDEGVPASMLQLRDKLQTADGYIIASPEYNSSMTAFFKNTIDWISRLERKIFGDKPVLMLSTSPGGRGGMTNLAHLVSIMPWWGAKVVDSYSMGSFHDKVHDDQLISAEQEVYRKLLEKLSEALFQVEA